MFKSNSTPAPSTVASTPGSTPDATGEPHSQHADTLEKQASAQRKVEVQLSKFELAQMKNIELIKQIDHARDKKEIYKEELNVLEKGFYDRVLGDREFIKNIDENLAELQTPSGKTMQTPFGNMDPVRLALLIARTPELAEVANQFKHGRISIRDKEQEIASLQSTIENISKKQESAKSDFKKSKMELTQAIDSLHAVKSSAPDEAELDHLVSAAAQKIAAADSAIAKLTLAIAQKDLTRAKSTMMDAMTKLSELSKEINTHHCQLNEAQADFLFSRESSGSNFDPFKIFADFLLIPKNKQMHENLSNLLKIQESESSAYLLSTKKHSSAQSHLFKAATEFEKSQKILEQADSAVARAKLALDQHVLDSDLTDFIHHATSTEAVPVPTPDHSDASGENHADAQVTATGTAQSLPDML